MTTDPGLDARLLVGADDVVSRPEGPALPLARIQVDDHPGSLREAGVAGEDPVLVPPGLDRAAVEVLGKEATVSLVERQVFRQAPLKEIQVRPLDIEPVLLKVGENAHYQPNPDLLADAGEIDGLIIASPANPTGTMIAAADLLYNDFGVVADVWSVPSFTELRREAIEVERWNMLHPTETPRKSHVETCLGEREGPAIAATDYMRTFADQIRAWVPRRYRVLGTDGFGRSDYRKKLRYFFEIDRHFVALAALKALADSGTIKASVPAEAIRKFGINPEKANPARS